MSHNDDLHNDLAKLAQVEKLFHDMMFKFRVDAAVILQTLECWDGKKIEADIDNSFGPKGAVSDEIDNALYDAKTSLKEQADEHDYHMSRSKRTAIGLAAE